MDSDVDCYHIGKSFEETKHRVFELTSRFPYGIRGDPIVDVYVFVEYQTERRGVIRSSPSNTPHLEAPEDGFGCSL